MPLTLIAPADQVIGIAQSPKRSGVFDPGLSIGIFPEGNKSEGVREVAEPLLRLGLKRRWGGADGEFNLGGSKEWFIASTAWDTVNWLHSILSLDPREISTRKSNHKDPARRFKLQTGLQICWEPADLDIADNDSTTSHAILKLIITVNIFFDHTKMNEIAPDVGSDLIGFVLHSLLPTGLPIEAVPNTDIRNTALKHFFACMQPAPFLPRGLSSSTLQPPAMSSTLLPFQIRTLRLLLERERANGYEVDAGASDPRGFWSQLELDDDRMGYRRLTGGLAELPAAKNGGGRKGKGRAMDLDTEESVKHGLSAEDRKLLPTLVDLSQVRGTMLCEEMGESIDAKQSSA